jgi:RNA polymerase sigma-70 factor (ECF subfamily)
VRSADDPLEQLTLVVRTRRRALVAAARDEGVGAEEALECVQEALCTFLRLEREGALPAGPEERVAATFTMVRNAARNARRRHHHARPHDSLGLDGGDPPQASPTAEELLVQAETTVRLRQCLASLCGVQRAVVTLRLLEERSGEDVAETLGLSRGYVDVLVHRAKAALRLCMRDGGPT